MINWLGSLHSYVFDKILRKLVEYCFGWAIVCVLYRFLSVLENLRGTEFSQYFMCAVHVTEYPIDLGCKHIRPVICFCELFIVHTITCKFYLKSSFVLRFVFRTMKPYFHCVVVYVYDLLFVYSAAFSIVVDSTVGTKYAHILHTMIYSLSIV